MLASYPQEQPFRGSTKFGHFLSRFKFFEKSHFEAWLMLIDQISRRAEDSQLNDDFSTSNILDKIMNILKRAWRLNCFQSVINTHDDHTFACWQDPSHHHMYYGWHYPFHYHTLARWPDPLHTVRYHGSNYQLAVRQLNCYRLGWWGIHLIDQSMLLIPK